MFKIRANRKRVKGERSTITRSFMKWNLFIFGSPRAFVDEDGNKLSEWYGNIEMKLKASRSLASQLFMKVVVREDYVAKYRLSVAADSRVVYHVDQNVHTGEIVKVEKEVFE